MLACLLCVSAVLLSDVQLRLSLDVLSEEVLVEVYSTEDQEFDVTVEALQDILLSERQCAPWPGRPIVV